MPVLAMTCLGLGRLWPYTVQRWPLILAWWRTVPSVLLVALVEEREAEGTGQAGDDVVLSEEGSCRSEAVGI
jgi:hypothetical protein